MPKKKSPKGKYNAAKKKRKSTVGSFSTPGEAKKSKHKEYEPEPLSCALSAGRYTSYHKSKNGTNAEAPSLYYEDVGEEGVKAKAKSTNLDCFSVPETHEEKTKRLARQKRFSVGSSISSTDPSFGSLSTPRTTKINATATGETKQSIKKGKKKKSKKNAKPSIESDNVGFGTCQNVEKPYLRLTTFPRVEDVRPLPVLTRSLAHIKCKYAEEEDFEWANEQMKSLRQDLTVQGFRNPFVLEVYEIHARMTLENGELNEFNQCQSMIKSLTFSGNSNDASDDVSKLGLKAKAGIIVDKNKSAIEQSMDASDEFAAYRLLYTLIQRDRLEEKKEFMLASKHCLFKTNEQNQREVEDKHVTKMSACQHAIGVSKSLIHNDCHAFFRLYNNAPNLSAYLMDFLVQRVRLAMYERMLASYIPSIDVAFLADTMSFHDVEEAKEFLKANGAVFQDASNRACLSVDCKASRK
eukprot:CAMPEP_0195506896 /NCGR_PEP_ID=MMETSP0794_2-20130614/434_1 /TAXON_ID=515487 /ORGANISM="Stephanopyxis turris, Strain CCMP 815" /LENGTH=465 /DNA_ID=CAMNT_0040633365 /DNA_START=209 /DNA_END=1606 /DNA_ORIENTATION=-